MPLAATNQGSPLGMWVLLALFILAAYFLIIRPQQRRRKQAEELQSSIEPGDEVMTVAGLYGKVVDIDDKAVTLEVAPGVTNRYARQAVGQVVNKASRPETEPKSESESETAGKDVVEPE